MWLHLAETSLHRGLKDLLLQEQQLSTLMSYAYRDQESKFTPIWQQAGSRVLIDSGAFTLATSTRQNLTRSDYLHWARDFRARHPGLRIRFMNFDVIGDQQASWKNWEFLQEIQPICVITFGATRADLERAAKEADYIALGGLVPLCNDRPRLKRWLDFCFHHLLRQGIPKVHLLGLAQRWILERYPFYSADTSGWSTSLRFGTVRGMHGIKRIPRYQDAPLINTHAVRQEIRLMQKRQLHATQIWAGRGIHWSDHD